MTVCKNLWSALRMAFLVGLGFWVDGNEALGQSVVGQVRSVQDSAAVDYAVVTTTSSGVHVETDANGRFALAVSAGTRDTLRVIRVGFDELRIPIGALRAGQRLVLDLFLSPLHSGMEVIVQEKRLDRDGMVVEEVSDFDRLPSTTGNLESLLPHIALGVSSGTGGELSSQYNVRGGSFDENIVMVNDFEIYRPQLVSSSQQEGLSFVNLDLTNEVSFSSGGFSARYGDKMSSVLDVRYKVPEERRASVTLGLLGGAAHLEGSRMKEGHRGWRYLIGARYRSNSYLLNSQDIKGEYDPRFLDVQAMLSYEFSSVWNLSLLTNVSRNQFNFIPENSEASIGNINESRKLQVDYSGGEKDQFTSIFNGLSLTRYVQKGSKSSFHKVLLSSTLINEFENFDIIGRYTLSETEPGTGPNAGRVIGVIGRGEFQEYTKNFFDAQIYSFQLRSGLETTLEETNEVKRKNLLQYGIGAKMESLMDIVRMWERVDSAGYSLPHAIQDDLLLLNRSVGAQNELSSIKYNAYVTDKYSLISRRKHEMSAEVGVRLHYWDANGEFFVNPRFQLLYRPLNWDKEFSFKLAGGMYHQPPFYREMRALDGRLNTDINSQKSTQILGGFTYDFHGRKRHIPYRLIVEGYYKALNDLIYYDVDNVRLLYSGDNNAQGYAYGVDLRLNGELIPGAESWINLSYLNTGERIDGVNHLRVTNRGEAGLDTAALRWVRRPSDRRLQATLFLQDYWKDNENMRMNLKIVAGSGLPYGFPEENIVVRNDFRLRAYYRVDLGLSFLLHDSDARKTGLLSFARKVWLDVGVFNLLDVANVASVSWIRDFAGRQHSIPNNLTSRRINVQLKFDL